MVSLLKKYCKDFKIVFETLCAFSKQFQHKLNYIKLIFLFYFFCKLVCEFPGYINYSIVITCFQVFRFTSTNIHGTIETFMILNILSIL